MAINKEKESHREDNKEKRDSAFIDHVVSLRRVTKVTKGGKRFSFAAFVISGDKQGKVGLGLGKSREVSMAIAKATNRARKRMIEVARRGSTIPYESLGKHGSSRVVVRPASKGTGNIAGGAVRAIMDAAGVEDVLTKSIGSSNGINVAKATMNALAKLRSADRLSILRGKTVQEMVKGS
ncbi:MAG TPA: 30S ribosomal protein S5 [Candidatus Babeliales bacterium]|nr:30S ribosomal protein S5 [Candidatus Babeliales bacterium]